MVTDALRGKTVCTDTGGGTWSLSVQTVAVWWRGDVAYSCDSSVCIRCNFVHATDNNDLCRTENQSSHAVAVAVRVDKLAVSGNGIGAHKIGVAGKCFAVNRTDLLRGRSL